MDNLYIDLNTTYPLSNTWTFFVHYYCNNNNYGSNYGRIYSFSTIQDFWRLYNNFPTADQLVSSYILHDHKSINAFSLFKDNIRPEWEHNKNMYGSEWGCRNIYSEEEFKNVWNNLVLAAIGNKIRNCTGVRAVNKSISYKTYVKIEIWLSTCEETLVNESFEDIMSCMENFEKLVFTHTKHEERKKLFAASCDTKLPRKKIVKKN